MRHKKRTAKAINIHNTHQDFFAVTSLKHSTLTKAKRLLHATVTLNECYCKGEHCITVKPNGNYNIQSLKETVS